MERVVENPARRTIHQRHNTSETPETQSPLNQTGTPGTFRSKTLLTRAERRPDNGSLKWLWPVSFPWHIFKHDLMKPNIQ